MEKMSINASRLHPDVFIVLMTQVKVSREEKKRFLSFICHLEAQNV